MQSEIHGVLLIITGAVHVIFGFLPNIYGNEWFKFLSLKFYKTVDFNDDKGMAAFWFVIFGLALILCGVTLRELEIHVSALPQQIGWILLGISALGSIMTPKSGFTTLLLPQAIFYLIRSH